jgi:hypothetical protein
MASPPNLVVVPIVTYEYLFCLPLSEQLWPPARLKVRGYCRGLVPWVPPVADNDPKKFGHDLTPSSGRTVGESLTPCQKVPLLMVEEEGPPT